MHLPFALTGAHARHAAAASLLWCAMAASAQTPAPCMDAGEASHQIMWGHWSAELRAPQTAPSAPPVATAQLVLTPHPEYPASVRGRLQRAGTEVLLAGDLDQGQLTLEESLNGTNISAVWLGEVEPGSCGREIRGTWTQEQPALTRAFVLRKKAVQ